MNGNLFIVSAPSGAGKTTLVSALLQTDPRVRKSVSYTTRAPRSGEANGREYHFVSASEFENMVQSGDFLETAHVHGNRYGTSRRWVLEQAAQGQDILLEIDWQGAAQVRKALADTVGVFVLPPSLAVLEERLKKRALDSMDEIELRLANAREEITHAQEFDYVIINEDLSQAAQDLVSIVRAERLKQRRQLADYGKLINRIK